MKSLTQMVKLAKVAIKNGSTRGQFIRENTSRTATTKELQLWSDAYSLAIPKHVLPEVATWLTTEMT
jgi:hypothetical protein